MLASMRLIALALVATGECADLCDSDASKKSHGAVMLQKGQNVEQKVEQTLEEGMSEPRCSLLNVKANADLTVDNKWKASFKCQSGRCNWFKMQKKEENADGFPTVAVIRTDWHPQSLLDADTMAFEGGAWDGGKCYKSSRWWNPLLLEVHEDKNHRANMAIFAFRVHDSRSDDEPRFLASDGNSVDLMKVKKDDAIPEEARWAMSVIGSAFSPGEVAAIVANAFGMNETTLTDGIGAAAEVAGWFSPASVVTAGTAAGGVGVQPALAAQVASGFFVDWDGW